MKAFHVIEILVTCGGEDTSMPPRRVSATDLNARQKHVPEANVGAFYTLAHHSNLTKSTKLVIVKSLLEKVAHAQVIRKFVKPPVITHSRLVDERFPLLNDCPGRLVRRPAIAAKELLERLEKFGGSHSLNWLWK